MDLSGRGQAYRGTIAACPDCRTPMRIENVPSAEIDVCDACGGLWLDWFDGEPHAVAVEIEAVRSGTPIAPVDTSEKHCPRCTKDLESELLRWLDARDEEWVTGVEVFRCGECAGVFIPRSSAHLLHDRSSEVQPLTGREAIVELLKRIFGIRTRKETRL